MKTLLFSLLALSFYPSQSMADEHCSEIKGMETKALEDIQQMVRFTLREPKNEVNCRELFQNIHEKYRNIATHIYKDYREYLNRFLTDYTSDSRQVREFLKLAEHLSDPKSVSLIKDLNMNAVGPEKALLTHLHSRLKEYKNLPTYHTCDVKFSKRDYRQKSQKILDQLISKELRLDNQNVCAVVDKKALHPTDQRSLRIGVSGGKVLIYSCHQRFYKDQESGISSRGKCLAFDLKAQKLILGDQRQSDLYQGKKGDVSVEDARLVMAKSQGFVPLTYHEFLSKNPDALPIDPKKFFLKAPKACSEGPLFPDAVHKARQTLLEMETESGPIDN